MPSTNAADATAAAATFAAVEADEIAKGKSGCENDRSLPSPMPVQPPQHAMEMQSVSGTSRRTGSRGIRLPTPPPESPPALAYNNSIYGAPSLARLSPRVITPVGWVPCAAAFAESEGDESAQEIVKADATAAALPLQGKAPACRLGQGSDGPKGHHHVSAGDKENCDHNVERPNDDSQIPHAMPLEVHFKPDKGMILCSATPFPRKTLLDKSGLLPQRLAPQSTFSPRRNASYALQPLSPLHHMR